MPTSSATGVRCSSGNWTNDSRFSIALSLLIFDGKRGVLLCAALRPGNACASTGLMPILRRLAARLRARWKHVKLIVRADAGFAIPDLYSFCEDEGIDYVIAYYGVSPLKTLNRSNVERAERPFKASNNKVRYLTSTLYRARSWNRRRRVLMKTEVTSEGVNERFVVVDRQRTIDVEHHRLFVPA